MPALSTTAARLATATPLAAVLLLAGASAASAHVEATAGAGAQAGNGPVTVAFVAEAESTTAGIMNLKTQLPAGVLSESVSLASGPAGWTLTTDGDTYTVAGPALAPGTDAEFTISIGQLPADRTDFTFKTLVRYSDDSEDAWIEEAVPGGREPENPAPVITVAPAPAPTTSAPSSTSASAPTTSASTTATSGEQSQATDEPGTSAWLIVTGVLVTAVVVGSGVVIWRRRSRSQV